MRRIGGMNGLRLGSVLGFEIRIDHSWFIIFFLVLWSLGAGFFPSSVPGLSGGVYFAMGAVATLLFFASLLAHQLSHSIVARRKGIPVEGITLFLFGGVARTRMEAETPRDEFVIAGVGPALSAALGGLFLAAAWLLDRLGAGESARAVASYLGFINFLLAAFNLLPGFPLDGGRLFRALAWMRTGDLTKATRWATTGGRWLGYGLVGLGILQTLGGAVLGGLWLVFIGWFLRNAADMSLRQHFLSGALEGVTARDVMSSQPETVHPLMSLQELVDDYLLRRRYQSFPVVDGDSVEGLVTLEQVKRVPRERWSATIVRDVMAPASRDVIVPPAEPITEVLARMRSSGTGRVLVASGDRLLGVISASDITRWARRAEELGAVPHGSGQG